MSRHNSSSPKMRRAVLAAAFLGVLVSTSVLAAREPGDPWEPANRKGYAVQDFLDRHIIHPLSKVYKALTPGPIRRGIHNVLVNLSEPAALFNDVMQLRIKRAGVPAARLVVNSTMGILGLFDVAAHMGLIHHDNEFGVTLGRYGLHPGPYVYIPLLGPGTVRDTLGGGVDYLTNPARWLTYPNQSKILRVKFAASGLDARVQAEPALDALLSNAVDPYATLRSAYLQNKQSEIDGEGVPTDLPSFDEPPAGGTPPATETPPATGTPDKGPPPM
jgi:phospholipid-binding lipoprotein MlaA